MKHMGRNNPLGNFLTYLTLVQMGPQTDDFSAHVLQSSSSSSPQLSSVTQFMCNFIYLSRPQKSIKSAYFVR